MMDLANENGTQDESMAEMVCVLVATKTRVTAERGWIATERGGR